MARPRKRNPTEQNPLPPLLQRKLDARIRHEIDERYREELKHDAEVRRARKELPQIGVDDSVVPDDNDLSACLVAYGLPSKAVQPIEDNNCERIKDLRGAAMSEEILDWDDCGPVTLRQIREALESLDREQERVRREEEEREKLRIRRIIRKHEEVAK